MRTIFAFGLAVVTAFVAGSVMHTQFVLAGLQSLGVAVPPSVRLDATLRDIAGLAPGYGGVIAVGFLIAFPVAGALRRRLPALSALAYPLAGAAAVVAALLGMNAILGGLTLLAGARSDLGFAMQALAGALGGAVYAASRPRKA